MIALSKMLPLISKLGEYLTLGMNHYADLRAAKQHADPEIVALFLRAKLDGWDPKVGDKKVLDAATRDAGARFLAGVACNLAGVK